MTKYSLHLNRYLVPSFGVHRMCVPYGMWGLKTQQVIQSERIIVNLKVGVSLRKRKLLRCCALEISGKYVESVMSI